jgi:hypothetical protein
VRWRENSITWDGDLMVDHSLWTWHPRKELRRRIVGNPHLDRECTMTGDTWWNHRGLSGHPNVPATVPLMYLCVSPQGLNGFG